MKITKVEEMDHRVVGTVDLDGSAYHVDLSLIDEPVVSDYVIVHAGIAIEKLNRAEADERLAYFDELAAIYRQELGSDVQLVAPPDADKASGSTA